MSDDVTPDDNVIDSDAAETAASQEITDDTVISFHKHVVRRNLELLRQLELIGKPIPHIFHIQNAVETIIDMIFDSPEALQAFHCAADVKLKEKLESILLASTGSISDGQ